MRPTTDSAAGRCPGSLWRRDATRSCLPPRLAAGRGTSRGIADVAIEILDGPYAGQIQETNDSGYFAFDFFPMGVPFTIRASKVGYDEITERHPGITDLPDPRYSLNIFLTRR